MSASQLGATTAYWVPNQVQDALDSLPEQVAKRGPHGRESEDRTDRKRVTVWFLLFLAPSKIPAGCDSVGIYGDVWVSPSAVQTFLENGWTDWAYKGIAYPYRSGLFLGYRPETNCMAFGSARNSLRDWAATWDRLTEDKFYEIFGDNFTSLDRPTAEMLKETVRQAMHSDNADNRKAYVNLTEQDIAALIYSFWSRSLFPQRSEWTVRQRRTPVRGHVVLK